MIQKIYAAIRKRCCHVYLGDITLLSIPLLSNAGDNNKVGFGSLALVFHSRTNYRLGFPLHWCCRFWPQVHWSNHKRREFSVDRSFNTCSFFFFFQARTTLAALQSQTAARLTEPVSSLFWFGPSSHLIPFIQLMFFPWKATLQGPEYV